jgi:hypothetical protein
MALFIDTTDHSVSHLLKHRWSGLAGVQVEGEWSSSNGNEKSEIICLVKKPRIAPKLKGL